MLPRFGNVTSQKREVIIQSCGQFHINSGPTMETPILWMGLGRIFQQPEPKYVHSP